VLRLNGQYPGDVGVLSAFFLNLVGAWRHHLLYLHACAHTLSTHTVPCRLLSPPPHTPSHPHPHPPPPH
jgi:hypothetical protein